MSAVPLHSDHVNYLIWRYLQESGHGEAAVKLERNWNVDPRSLPFAQYIRTHALVLLVQKGLQYYEIEQSLNQHGDENPSVSSPVPFFGPNSGRNTSSANGDASEDETAYKSRNSPRTRKHGRENTANGLGLEVPNAGPATKRSRKSDGIEFTTDPTTINPTSNGNSNHHLDSRGSDSMDIDQNGYSRLDAPEPTSASNSPAAEIPDALTGAVAAGTGNGMDVDEDEDVDGQGVGDGGDDDDDDDDAPAPAPDQQQQQQHARSSIETRTQTLTLTNGESVGVQSDKVRELGPETSLLCVPDKIVMHTAWNPQDPQILATGGDALCRIWTVSTKSIQSPEGTCPERQQQQQFVDTLDPSDTSLITAMAWSSDGEILAVATRSDTPGSTGGVSLWDKTGRSRDELMTVPDMILMFRWNPSGTHLLGITSSGRGRSALVVWDTRSSDAMCPLELQDIVTDAAWSDDQKFTICGHNRIVQMSIETQSIVALHSRTEEEKYQSWTHIRFDAASNTTAIAAEESAVLGIIDARGNLKTTTAHDAEITALAYQPISNPSSYTFTSPRLLATSSLDGNVRIWDANQPFTTVHVLSLGHSTPPMAISFTPDGYLVAAASWNRVLIWNAEIGGMPKASWKGEPGKWQSLGVNGVDQDSGIGEEDEGPTHSLSWDADGGKLAYGLGSQIAIINFRP